jgi:hypothetical protein
MKELGEVGVARRLGRRGAVRVALFLNWLFGGRSPASESGQNFRSQRPFPTGPDNDSESLPWAIPVGDDAVRLGIEFVGLTELEQTLVKALGILSISG